MKLMNKDEMDKITAEGINGLVDVWDGVSEDGVVAGIREVHPNSTVPGAGHQHTQRQLNFVISGLCNVYTTNEDERTELKPGDFLLFDANEPHYFTTYDEPAVIFEVRYL
jgi:gentisate 1,2-dioxygenase